MFDQLINVPQPAYRQVLSRSTVADVRCAELLRLCYLTREGLIRYRRNSAVAYSLINRGSLDLEKHGFQHPRYGFQLNENAYKLVRVGLIRLQDCGMLHRVSTYGTYRITAYGRWIVEQWFDINAPH